MALTGLILFTALAQAAPVPPVPAVPAFQTRVTLQVRTESGETAGSVAGFLMLRDMLGSIAPNLVPLDAAAEESTPDRVVVSVSTSGSEMLVIRAFGDDRAAVEQGAALVVEHLRRIEPGNYRERRDMIDRANAALAKAEATCASALAAQQAYVAKFGAIDPTQRLQLLQSSAANRGAELKQAEMNVAENQARVDYLRAMLQRTPPMAEESVEVNTGETRMLAKQLDDLEALHAQILVKQGAGHAETKASGFKIDEVRQMLADRRFTVRQRPNPRYTEIEQKLYLLEADVAQDVTRRDLMRKMITESEAEAARLTLIAGDYSQIWRAVEGAEQELSQARHEKRNAERAATGLSDGWFAVVAGPTTQVRRP